MSDEFFTDARLVPLPAVGHGLIRPESVLCTRAGAVYTSRRDGATRVENGSEHHFQHPDSEGWMTNGIALLADGRLLLANLGLRGGVWQVDRDGRFSPFVLQVDGVALPPTNYVGVDDRGRVWITVSTRRIPRDLAFHEDVADGFVVMVDDAGARIVLDGVRYTNEARVDPTGQWLYVVETMARQISRHALGADGRVSPRRECMAQFGIGTFPDGFAFDADGGLWVAAIVGNRLVHVACDGTQTLMLRDADEAMMDEAEQAFRAGTFTREHLEAGSRRALRSITSVAFGGRALDEIHLGCLAGSSIRRYRAPVRGVPPPHWHVG